MRRVYLDYNATTPVAPEVLEAMLPYLREDFGNPSSLHGVGARARKALEDARETIARCLSCSDREIVFTRGGTESVNLALQGVVAALLRTNGEKRPHVVTSAVEHQAVLQTIESLEKEGRVEVTRLQVDASGDLDLREIEASLRETTVLISIMFVNNETGNIYPITAIGNLARARGIPFHTDAVQAVGKLPVDLKRLPVDLLSFSSHKIYGPKGVGALYIRKGVRLRPILFGGAQEMEKRGGTENLAGVVGFGAAMERIHHDMEKESARVASLRDRLQAGLIESVPGTRIHGKERHRIGNTLMVTFEGVTSETILLALDRQGIAVSAGSACASGALEPSHVLMAMGVASKEAKGAVRFSLGRQTTEDDINKVLDVMPAMVAGCRST